MDCEGRPEEECSMVAGMQGVEESCYRSDAYKMINANTNQWLDISLNRKVGEYTHQELGILGSLQKGYPDEENEQSEPQKE